VEALLMRAFVFLMVTALAGCGGHERTLGAYQSTIQHLTASCNLACLQGKTSGVAFNIGAVLPANATLVAPIVVGVPTAISGGTIASAVATVQGGSDAAGTLIASTSVFTGAATKISVAGSNPYPTRGGQQLKMTIITAGDTLANAVAGSITLDAFYTVTP
jgi:hypothetical protein